MRKSLILMLIATLLVGAFLVSCNSEVTSGSSSGDKLVKVTIAGNTKGISAVSTADDADNYYWYYKAVKNDNSVYRTGTTEWKAVKNGKGLSGADLGYFSAGEWKFSFWGYSNAVGTAPTTAPAENYVYYQENLTVKVVKTDETPTYVSVTLKEGTLGQTATVVINTMKWKYIPENNTSYQATLDYLNGKAAKMHFAYSVNGDDYTGLATSIGTISKSDNYAEATFLEFTFTNTATIPASIDGKENTIKFWVTVGDEKVGDDNTIKVIAYSGGVVTLSVDSTGVAVADNEAINKVIIDDSVVAIKAQKSVTISENKTNTAPVSFTSYVTPSDDTSKTTTVEFPVDSLKTDATINTSTNSSVEMEVVVYQTEAAQAKFKVVEGTTLSSTSAFAGLDLNVDLITTTTVDNVETKTTKSISSFNEQAVTIKTYIAKGLSNVKVVYNGTELDQPIFSGKTDFANEEALANYEDSLDELKNGTGYVPSTGLLVFKTTHFSEFVVGANENVYDKTSNTGYRLGTEEDGALYKGLLLTVNDQNVATGIASVSSEHEYLLLDSTKANDVDDSIDAFNAGIKWSVVHAAADAPNTTVFDGGYGTKIEPYLVASTAKMHNISELYNDGAYSYYVFTGSTANPIDCSTWEPIRLKGSFDGKGVVFSNLPVQLFEVVGGDTNNTRACVKNFTIKDVYMVVTGYYCAPVVNWTENLALLTIDNVKASGYAEADIVSSFVGWSEASATVIKNSESSLTLVSTSNQVSGFVGNSLGTNTVTVIDSTYNGSEASTAAAGQYLYAHCNGNCTLTLSYTSDFVASHSNLYPAFSNKAQQLNSYSIYTQLTKSSLELPPDVGTPITVQKDANAVKAIATYVIGVNPGNFTRVFQRDDIDLSSVSENTFNTNTVKKYNIVINDGVHGNGAIDTTQYIRDSACNGTYHCVVFTVVQYDENKAITSIRTTSLPGNDQ